MGSKSLRFQGLLLVQGEGEEETQALVEDDAAQHAQQARHAQHAGTPQAKRFVREYQLTPIASSPTRLGSHDGALLRSSSGGIPRGLQE